MTDYLTLRKNGISTPALPQKIGTACTVGRLRAAQVRRFSQPAHRAAPTQWV